MSYFGHIYADEELPSRAKAVYMYLRDRSNTSGKCWPGIKTIARELNLSRSTVKRALDDLYQAELITRETRRRENGSLTSNLYSINDKKKTSNYEKTLFEIRRLMLGGINDDGADGRSCLRRRNHF